MLYIDLSKNVTYLQIVCIICDFYLWGCSDSTPIKAGLRNACCAAPAKPVQRIAAAQLASADPWTALRSVNCDDQKSMPWMQLEQVDNPVRFKKWSRVKHQIN